MNELVVPIFDHKELIQNIFLYVSKSLRKNLLDFVFEFFQFIVLFFNLFSPKKQEEFIFYWPRRMRVLQDIAFDQFHCSQIEYQVFSNEPQEPKLPFSSSSDHHN